MITNAEIIQYWGNNNLLKINKESIDHLRLSSDTKEYLTGVGVVATSTLIKNSLGISFDLIQEDKVVTLSSYFAGDLQGSDISESLGSWMLLGHCYDKLVCINIDDDSVVNLEGDPESGFIDWFVNSSVDKYMQFITIAVQSFEKGGDGSTASQSLHELKQFFCDADPEAMRKTTYWWPIILSDIRNI